MSAAALAVPRHAHQALAFAGASGHFELNVFNPVMAYNFLQSVQLISDAAWQKQRDTWLPTVKDQQFVKSLMKPVTEPGKIAGWIAPPAKGINGQPADMLYVKLG